MAHRRFHRKTKSGCTSCKARKIKCDEFRPTCQHCVRSASTCIYDKTPGVTSLASPKAPISHDNTFSYDTLDLILMHHYSTTTSLNLFPWQEARHAWQSRLPKEAQSQPILMHGILALSGIDMARLSSGDVSSYRLRALHHQNLALSIFRHQLKNDSITPASVAFSVILIVLTFASPLLEAEELSIDTILSLLSMFRGGKELWLMGAKQDVLSLFQQLIQPPASAIVRNESPELLNCLDRFEVCQGDNLLKETVRLLRKGYIKFGNAPFDVCAIGFWPAMYSEEFHTQLCKHCPEALVVLAQYSLVLLEQQECWWMGDWHCRLLLAISEILTSADKERLNWNSCLVSNKLNL